MNNMVDLHTHILPGLDDGADSIEESVKMAQALHDMGFKHVFATPHHRLYSWGGLGAESVRSGLVELEEAISGKGLRITLYPGIEYDLDETLVQRAQNRPEGAGHLLVDIGFWDVPNKLTELLGQLRDIGVDVLLVHPERNGTLCRRTEMLKSLMYSGVRLVGNLGSLSGYYGNGIRRDAISLLKAGCYWAMASDLHSHDQASWVKNGLTQLRQQADLSTLQDLMFNNPVQIVKTMMEERP